jgi:hypothetical protein
VEDGTQNPAIPQLAVNPNPFKNNLTISYWQDKSPAQLTIYNLRGQKIYEQSFAGGQNSFVAQNLHLDLPSGVYLFSLVIKGSVFRRSFSHQIRN